MKKLLVLFIVFAAVAIAGCGGSNEKKTESIPASLPQAAPAAEKKTEVIKINGKDVEIVEKDGNFYDAKTGNRVYRNTNKVNFDKFKKGAGNSTGLPQFKENK